jgi:uncharacterized protein with PQ loop repeat
MFSDFVAWLAALLTSLLMLPHAVAAYQGEDSFAPSNKNVITITVAAVMWSIHGFIAKSSALMFAGPLILLCSGYILYTRFYKNKSVSSRSGTSGGRTPVRRRR